MGRVLWLALGILAVVTLTAAEAVVKCIDGKKSGCEDFRVITPDSNEISQALQQHRTVRKVDLHGNLMEEFDMNRILNANQWKFLNLSYNLLGYIDLSNSRANTIDLTYNNLTSVRVPASMIEFRAERNQLWDVKFNGRNIQKLILSKNRIDNLNDITNLNLLKYLDLSCNRISELDFGRFAGMSQLAYLNLARNRIYTTSGNSPLYALRVLDLSYNTLLVIDASFSSAANVEELYVQNNKIVMVMDQPGKTFKNLRVLDARNNDWSCKSIKDLHGLSGQGIRPKPDGICETGYIKSQDFCCSEAGSPYADRLIRYRKQESYALRNSSAQRRGQVDCSNYVPNPCDGDDNLVYNLAGAAARDAVSLANANLEELKAAAINANTLLNRKQNELKKKQDEQSHEEQKLTTLKEKITSEYNAVGGLPSEMDPLNKLDKLFKKLDSDNAGVIAEIKRKELDIQNTLDDITRLQEELDDEKYKNQQLLEDINKRNSSINALNEEIKVLEARIAG